MSQGMVTGEIERLVDINSKGDNKLSLWEDMAYLPIVICTFYVLSTDLLFRHISSN